MWRMSSFGTSSHLKRLGVGNSLHGEAKDTYRLTQSQNFYPTVSTLGELYDLQALWEKWA